ncbi:MAG: hypothetical protein MSC30_20360 [Gaiellaceae bacterium MAG52_C11]|nr:hypothetical protein [Candidatus Gaiellasilicea maunaloa]
MRARSLTTLALGALALAGTAVPAEATFPGRNGRIVFTLTSFGRSFFSERLQAVAPATGRRIPLRGCGGRGRRGTSCHDREPIFAPGGRRFYFVAGSGGPDPEPENSRLVVARPDGSIVRSVRDPFFGTGGLSPNGRRMAFGARRGMQTLSVATGWLRPLNRVRGYILDVDWSSRNRLLYERRYRRDELIDGRGIDLYAVNPGGKRLRRLTTDGRSTSAEWSPDGRRIVYERGRPGVGSASTIWTMDVDGSNKHRIARGFSPTWSPDGRKIAYARGIDIDDRTVLYIARPDGTHRRRLLSIRDGIGTIAWQPLPGNAGG